jgi:hypothetical protein
VRVPQKAKLGTEHVRHVCQPIADPKHEHAAQLPALGMQHPAAATRPAGTAAARTASAAAARTAAVEIGVGRAASRERNDAHLSHGRRELVETEVGVPLRRVRGEWARAWSSAAVRNVQRGRPAGASTQEGQESGGWGRKRWMGMREGVWEGRMPRRLGPIRGATRTRGTPGLNRRRMPKSMFRKSGALAVGKACAFSER